MEPGALAACPPIGCASVLPELQQAAEQRDPGAPPCKDPDATPPCAEGRQGGGVTGAPHAVLESPLDSFLTDLELRLRRSRHSVNMCLNE